MTPDAAVACLAEIVAARATFTEDEINDRLLAHSKPEDLVTGPVGLFLETPTPSGLDKAKERIAQGLAALRIQTRTRPTPRRSRGGASGISTGTDGRAGGSGPLDLGNFELAPGLMIGHFSASSGASRVRGSIEFRSQARRRAPSLTAGRHLTRCVPPRRGCTMRSDESCRIGQVTYAGRLRLTGLEPSLRKRRRAFATTAV